MTAVRTIAAALLACQAFTANGIDDSFLVGTVTKVTDGDTITVELDSGPIKVRFDSIDAPEHDQPWGGEATEALAAILAGEEVALGVTTQDRYERLVAVVYLGNKDINAWMVGQGHAWVYPEYAHDESLYDLETDARAAQRGLWALPDAQRVPPWEWRRSARGGAPSSRSAVPGAAMTCGTKTVCAEMTSCSEARYYLGQCGLARLDGDNDGVPCEEICP